MTADEALALAKFQRPGVKLIVGATEAREVRFYPEVIAHEAARNVSVKPVGLLARLWRACIKALGNG